MPDAFREMLRMKLPREHVSVFSVPLFPLKPRQKKKIDQDGK